ncbi:MAG: hypothetical protein JWO57_2937, partial [Pseudonocardiales bacterium]|nr:hypothetical protein [Pseudonocardiales bacterium]
MTDPAPDGLALHPFRALRPAVEPERLGRLLSPPYDVIDAPERARLLAQDRDNAVGVVLPEAENGVDRYAAAAQRLHQQVARGLLEPDAERALYVYEMRDTAGAVTRGLLGAVELRDPADGVILPHENTMAGPVADRLALMEATQANVEPIYLVYDGGGPASTLVADVAGQSPIAHATTPDGIAHRLWAVTDPAAHRAVADDLAPRRALIADGHHRYATYRELQRRYDDERGPGPWDRGLTLLVDSSSYGPQVHAIHRVLVGFPLESAIAGVRGAGRLTDASSVDDALQRADAVEGFAAVLTNGSRTVLLTDSDGSLRAATRHDGEPAALAELDVTVLHRALVEQLWALPDTVEVVGYAHSTPEAIEAAAESGGTAVLLRPTPVAAVAAVAAAG